MSALLAQAPTLQLFAPVLAASALALTVLVLGRVAAAWKFARASQSAARWAPSIPTAEDHPLNGIDPRPRGRVSFSELLSASEAEIDLSFVDLEILEPSPADSAAMTLRVKRIFAPPPIPTPA